MSSDVADGEEELRLFFFEAGSLDGASVSREEREDGSGSIVVTYDEHDSASQIDASPILDLADEMDLLVWSVVADFDAEHVLIEVVTR